MAYDYFYGPDDAEQYAFYRIPKSLITGRQFDDISVEAKLLYGLMLDRLSLSLKNGWFDDLNRAYIIYTIEDIMSDLHCGNQKAVKLLNELEKRAGLIIKKRQGLGKPSLIFVLKFTATASETSSGSHSKKCENHTSGSAKTTSQEMCKSQRNKNNLNKLEINKLNLINQSDDDGMEVDVITKREQYRTFFHIQLCTDEQKEKYPYDQGRIQEIEDLCVETLSSSAKTIRISGENKPAEIVKDRFLKLNSNHVDYLLDSFHEQAGDIRNIKQYMMAMLYNAPLTIDHYYLAKVHRAQANYDPNKQI